MKKLFWLPLLLLGFTAQAQLIVEDEVTQALQQQEDNKGSYLPVVLFFYDTYNFDSLVVAFEDRHASKNERVSTVLKVGPAHTERVIGPWMPAFESLQSNGSVRALVTVWLCNGIFLELKADKLAELQQLNPPAFLMLNATLPTLNPGTFVAFSPEAANGTEPGLRAIKAPFMWNLGYSGRNQRVYVYDSGTRSEHPAIRERFLGNRFPLAEGWKSYFGNTIPIDRDNEHGTHVAGTIIGLQKSNNDTIGVAPGGYFLSNDIIPSGGNLASLINAFQFAINPDGNAATTHDAADVINNSWGFPANGAACGAINGTFAALEASGIANVFAAGNDGPGAGTAGGYGAVAVDSLRNFAVGNLDANNASLLINSTSSRGPTVCAPSAPLNIKPEVSAPGTNIRSSVNGNGYALYTGTSMASPHVSGAVMLLGEAFPEASPRQKLNALYQTAIDLGTPGMDNDYGRGMIDLQAAYNFLDLTFTPAVPNNSPRDLAIQRVVGRVDGDRFCASGSTITETIEVKNVGTEAITAFDVQYGIGNYNSTANWTGNLTAGQSVNVALNIPGPFTGTYSELFARVRPSGTAVERDTINNYFTIRMRRQDGNTAFGNRDNARHQDFANPAVLNGDWLVNNVGGDAITWESHNVVGLPGTSSAVKVRMNNYSPAQAQIDELLSPYFSPSGGSGNVDLHFRMAYRNRSGFNDSLSVYVSNDCTNWTRVYTTGGTEMVTYGGGLEPTQASHWRMVRIPQVIPVFQKTAIKFVTRNAFGGNLYLTNISYGDVPLGLFETEAPGFKLYPNPTQNSVNIQLNEATVGRVLRVSDQSGRELLRRELAVGEDQIQLDLANFAAGFYLVQLQGAGGINTQKLVITK